MRDDEDAIDRAIEQALYLYSNPEPLAGMEQRILKRVRAESARGRVRWPWWLAAAVAAVAAGAALVAWLPRQDRLEVRLPAAPSVTGIAKRPPLPVIAGQRKGRTAGRGLPYRRDFPTPTPPTAEERVLMAFVAQAPRQASIAFSDGKQPETEPIRLDEIKIEPLQTDNLP